MNSAAGLRGESIRLDATRPPSTTSRDNIMKFFLFIVLLASLFGFFAPPSPAFGDELSETAKTEALLSHIQTLTGAVFIRNGQEHDAEEAADHLRRKWRHAGAPCETAEGFIEHCASRSSLTGRPYRIRLSDGRTLWVADYLRNRLAELKGNEPF